MSETNAKYAESVDLGLEDFYPIKWQPKAFLSCWLQWEQAGDDPLCRLALYDLEGGKFVVGIDAVNGQLAYLASEHPQPTREAAFAAVGKALDQLHQLKLAAGRELDSDP